MDNDFETVILSACRTPIGAFGGVFKEVSAVDLGAIVIREAVARAGVKPADVGDVVMGCVLQAGAGMNVARQAGLKAGLPVDVPGETVNRVCGSGMQAVVHAVEAIRVGYVDTIVAGGTESMSNAPYLLTGARWGYRMGNAEVVDSMLHEGLTCAIGQTHMGITAEEVASRYNVSRSDQDAFAAESQRRAVGAMSEGRFKAEIVPVSIPQKKGEPLIVDRDEYPRPGTTVEKLAALKPVFDPEGTTTAGNAPGVNDGASCVIVCSEEWARKRGLEPLATIVGQGYVADDFAYLARTPAKAGAMALDRAGKTIDDVKRVEINEAFSSVALNSTRMLGADEAVVNVNGGAVALGHPIGASGGRIVGTMVHELRRNGGGLGLAAICSGGGQGDALLIEV